jgi:hypothetical protein
MRPGHVPRIGGPRRPPGWVASNGGRRHRPAGRAAGLLRRRGDGHQGPRLDGQDVRAAGVLLSRDRPQPADGRPLPSAGRGLRRRRRRGPAGGARHAVGPRVGARGGGGRPGQRRRGRRRRLPAGDQGPPRGQGAGRPRLQRDLRRPPGPRRGGRHDGGGARSGPPGRDRGRRGRPGPRRRGAGGVPGPDHVEHGRVGRRARRRPRPLSLHVDARPQRPVLRHHQPPVRTEGRRRPRRRHRRHRLGQLVQHRRPGEGGPLVGGVARLPGEQRRRAAVGPVRRNWSRRYWSAWRPATGWRSSR